LQLPATKSGAVAGRHAEPSDRHAGVQRTGSPWISAERGVYLSSLLRPLPRMRTRARARPALQTESESEAGDAVPCQLNGGEARTDVRQPTLRALFAVSALPPPRRWHGSGQPRAV